MRKKHRLVQVGHYSFREGPARYRLERRGWFGWQSTGDYGELAEMLRMLKVANNPDVIYPSDIDERSRSLPKEGGEE